ncbi:hypothetical protein P691DRAFT_769881, partial [Macrolepiota fuliginosa MF-IS2]
MPEENGEPGQQLHQPPDYAAPTYLLLRQQVMGDTGITEEDTVALLGRVMQQVQLQQDPCNEGKDDQDRPPALGPGQPLAPPASDKKK